MEKEGTGLQQELRQKAKGFGRGSGRGCGRGSGRGRESGRGCGRNTLGTTPPILQNIPASAKPIEVVDGAYIEYDEFSPIRKVGPQLPDSCSNPLELDLFNLYFTDEVIDHLVVATNEYAELNNNIMAVNHSH